MGHPGVMTTPIVTRVVLSATATIALAAAILAGLVLHATSQGRVLALGVLGGTSLLEVAVLVAGAAVTVLVVGGSWGLTRRSRLWPQLLVRALATTIAVALGLCLCVVAWLGALGSVRYVDVGTVDGRTVTVAEYQSLAGLGASLGYRDGWFVSPAGPGDIPGSAVGTDDGAGDPQSEFGHYRLEIAPDQVTVRFGDEGQNVLVTPRL